MAILVESSSEQSCDQNMGGSGSGQNCGRLLKVVVTFVPLYVIPICHCCHISLLTSKLQTMIRMLLTMRIATRLTFWTDEYECILLKSLLEVIIGTSGNVCSSITF